MRIVVDFEYMQTNFSTEYDKNVKKMSQREKEQKQYIQFHAHIFFAFFFLFAHWSSFDVFFCSSLLEANMYYCCGVRSFVPLLAQN